MSFSAPHSTTTSPSITPRPSIQINSRPSPDPGAEHPEMITPPQPSTSKDSERSKIDGNGSVPAPSSSSSSRGQGSGVMLKPVGLVNETNTCYFNSVLQSLCATPPLISLLSADPTNPLIPAPNTILPPCPRSPTLIPSLLPSTLEPPLYQLLPVTRTFLQTVRKAWTMKDNGAVHGRSGQYYDPTMSIRYLLREMARKYDQYDDFRQQDAHELLRHLLDSMEMEEKDVIKRVQPLPPPPVKAKKSRKADLDVTKITPLPSPAQSRPPSPTSEKVFSFNPNSTAINASSGGETNGTATHGKETADLSENHQTKVVPENERLIPFVDVLFGGLLASVVVCETCKSVSHTYEGFLDISLSMKGDTPRVRKRDRFRAITSRFRPRAISAKSGSESTAVASDSEMSDHEPQERERRGSFDLSTHKNESPSISRSGSTKAFGLRTKPSFSFRRGKKDSNGKESSRPSSSTSAISSSQATTEPTSTAQTLSPNLPISPSSTATNATRVHGHGAGPTPSQAAYIQRILHGPPGPPEPNDPLAKLRAAHSGDSASAANHKSADTGLVDSLKAFTSVEVLEGENAFACRKCWKIKSGRYGKPLVEEDEAKVVGDNVTERSSIPPSSPSVIAETASLRTNAPSIAVNDRDAEDEDEQQQPTLVEPEPERVSRFASAIHHVSMRTPSPLRQQIDLGEKMKDDFTPSSDHITSRSVSGVSFGGDSMTDSPAGLGSTLSGGGTMTDVDEDETDGLSNTSSDEEPPENRQGSYQRPRFKRTQSKHFVLRRAFKRYLISKAPEVLVFHIKRFKQSQKASSAFDNFASLTKMDDFVSFPENLDLAPFLAPNRADFKVVQTPLGPRAPYMDWPSPEQCPEPHPCMYRLYAVVVHIGSMVTGHYIAYCLVDPERMFKTAAEAGDPDAVKAMEKLSLNEAAKTSSTTDRRVWCYCSDTSVRLASVEEVMSCRAYLCFYEKLSA